MRRTTARELTALADGTLATERRVALLRKVAASPSLAQALARQMLTVEAVRLIDTPAPTEPPERIRRTIQEACLAAHRNRRPNELDLDD